MTYFDTSYIVKCYVLEPGARVVRELAATQEHLACCELGKVELLAAFHRKFRENQIDRAGMDALVRQFELDDSQGLWNWLPLSEDLLEKTRKRFVTLPVEIYLRTADAIHLTCAAEVECWQVYSHDTHFLAASKYFGVEGLDIL